MGSGSLRFHVVASEADIPAIVSLAREAHAESRFGYIPFSEAKARRIVERALADPKRHAFMLAHHGTAPVGMAYCSVGEYHIGTGVLLTTIHNINARRAVRRALAGGKVFLGLLRGVESWSRARNSSELLLHITSGLQLDQINKLAERTGFHEIGGSFAKKW